MECRKCKRNRPEDGYSRSMWERKLKGLTAECRDCKSAYMSIRYKKEKERLACAENMDVVGDQCCKRCKQHKQRSAFSAAEWKRFAAGLTGLCRECTRDYKLQSNYRLNATDVETMLSLQGFVCAICCEPLSLKDAHVDHHHESGRNRELLCSRCNTAIGLMREDPRIMRSAIAYIKKHHPEKKNI